MRVCSITPHLPPEQAANALLPRQLGDELASRGVSTRFVAHPPAASRWCRRTTTCCTSRDADAAGCADPCRRRPCRRRPMARGAYASIRASDLVHLHGNGLIIEVGRFLAERYRKPYVITLYGTDVWHHDPARHARFAQVVQGARQRIFYSQGLLEFARPHGLAPEPSSVIYAPVPATFHPLDARTRTALRRELAIGDARVLLTVKRLHEVAGHDVLLAAFQRVASEHPDAVLWIVGRR